MYQKYLASSTSDTNCVTPKSGSKSMSATEIRSSTVRLVPSPPSHLTTDSMNYVVSAPKSASFSSTYRSPSASRVGSDVKLQSTKRPVSHSARRAPVSISRQLYGNSSLFQATPINKDHQGRYTSSLSPGGSVVPNDSGSNHSFGLAELDCFSVAGLIPRKSNPQPLELTSLQLNYDDVESDQEHDSIYAGFETQTSLSTSPDGSRSEHIFEKRGHPSRHSDSVSSRSSGIGPSVETNSLSKFRLGTPKIKIPLDHRPILPTRVFPGHSPGVKVKSRESSRNYSALRSTGSSPLSSSSITRPAKSTSKSPSKSPAKFSPVPARTPTKTPISGVLNARANTKSIASEARSSAATILVPAGPASFPPRSPAEAPDTGSLMRPSTLTGGLA